MEQNDALDSNGKDHNPQDGNQVDAGFLFNLSSFSTETKQEVQCVPLTSKRDDLYYNMNSPINGRCIILNYESFDSADLSKRRGTDVDVKRLTQAFKKLNFIIQPYKDLTLQKTFDVFRQESMTDHSSFNCFVICVLTHGSNGILHTKDRKFDTNKMFEFFTGSRCPTLVGKPKMFFIQACQGDMFDSGVLAHDSPANQSSYFMVPNYADFLIFYSTFPGFYSWRNVEHGSWFVQTLCEVLEQYAKKYDLMTMLTVVCQKVANNYESRVPNDMTMHKKKQMPCIMSTLTKLLAF